MPRIIDVVQAPDQAANQMVYRVPESGSGDFRIGSQVVVRENQAAVFFRDGKALDTFGPGRHTITTANIPLLISLLKLVTGGQTPFTAEVYFVNMRDFIDMKWGTPEPIALRDKDLGLARLRANGRYSMAISDPQMFVAKIVGTQGLYQTSQIEDYLRGIIISRLTDLLGEIQVRAVRPAGPVRRDERGHQGEGGRGLRGPGHHAEADVHRSLSPTEETQKAIDERAAMGAIGDMQKYLQYKAARAHGRRGQGGRRGGRRAPARAWAWAQAWAWARAWPA